MNAWLIYDHEGADRNRDYIDYHYEVGSRYGVNFELKYTEEISESAFGQAPSFAIVRTIRPDLNKLLEEHGIPTYNNYKVSYMANHKGRCISYISEKTNVPVIPTEVISIDDDIRKVLTGKQGYVIKPASGHGGIGVRRVSDDDSMIVDLEKRTDNDDLILQPFIEGPGEDVRVYVIGKEIIAAVKRRAPKGEFRANASLGGHIERYSLSDAGIDYVSQITDILDFGMVGIDFIIDENNHFIFSEIEDVVGSRMLYKTHPEIDILDRYINYILKSQ